MDPKAIINLLADYGKRSRQCGNGSHRTSVVINKAKFDYPTAHKLFYK